MEYLTKSLRLDEEVIAWLDKLKQIHGSYNKGLRLIAFARNGKGERVQMTPDEERIAIPPLAPGNRDALNVVLDATGPELSSGKGKATVETRSERKPLLRPSERKR